MTPKTYLLIIGFFIVQLSYGQKIKAPATIKEAIGILASDCPSHLQEKIKETPDEVLFELSYPWGDYETIDKWVEETNKTSKIKKYLVKNGVESFKHQQNIILTAFKRHLLGKPIDKQAIITPFKKIEDQWRKEDKIRLETDSLRGEYIPKNLEDCFQEIDCFWNDTTKAEVQKMPLGTFLSKTHFGFGMWIRNNWQLWSGSRLSQYFNDLCVYHPDHMSSIILTSYHRYLNEQPVQLEEQLKFYQE